MAAGQEPRTRRDDLASLRLDRGDRAPRRGRRSRRLLIGGGVALLLLLAALLVLRLTLARPLAVEVVHAARSGGEGGAGETVLRGSGYVITADRYISLGVRVPGRIEAYLVEEGARVVAGQPLVRLDRRQYEAALAEARANLRLARANVELRRNELRRQQALFGRQVASEAQLDVSENQLRVAEAEAERLRAQIARLEVDLDDTVLRAPVDGLVLEKFKEVGEIATPGGFAGSGELIRMANLDELRAEVDVNEVDLAKVQLGQPAEVVPDAYPERSYRARVVKLAPQIDRQKGTLEVELAILEPDAWLRPDMSVRISFLADEPSAARTVATVRVPGSALRTDASGRFVWTVRDGRLRRQPVQSTGEAADGQAVVTQGLAGGEAVVVGDAPGLREGRAVRAVPVGTR